MTRRIPPTPRYTAAVALCALALAGCADAGDGGTDDGAADDPGTAGFHLDIDLDGRSYDVFAPETAAGAEPLPAVLVLHGMPGSPASAQADSGMHDLAEQEGFLAVFPDGDTGSWSAAPDTPDLDYITDLIDDLVATWNADPERIYVSGISNGADMALVVGAALPDRVAGVGAVAPSGTGGVMDAVRELNAPTPTVAFLGGQDRRLGTGMEIMERWRESAGCGEEETAEEETAEEDELETSTWQCDEGTEVVVHVVAGQGHVWFGEEALREPLWASSAMWEFFTAAQ